MSKRQVSLDGPDDWQMMLESSYHHLCRSVRPEAFFSWLRSKGVLTREDQEEIEHKYMTTVMKTGHLIDKVKTKGPHGFKAFMEVVEYVYPDTFNILTGKQPKKPPPEFEPNASIGCTVVRERRGAALSAEILGQMGDLVNVLSQANAYKKEELAKLQNYVKTLQEENQTMCEENRSTLLKFKDAQEEIEQFKQKLNALQMKYEHDGKELKTKLKECERLRELKDKYMEECRKLRQDRDDLDCRMLQLTEREIHRSKTCRVPFANQHELVREENRLLLLERDKLLTSLTEFQTRLHEQNAGEKHKGSTLGKISEAKNVDLGPVKSHPMSNEQQIQELELTRDEQDMKLKEWQNKHTMLQERYDHILVNLEEVKTERDQMRHQLEDLQSMYDKEREANKRLVANCDKYQDRFCDMESQMTSLKMEIEQLQSLQSSINSPNLSSKTNRCNESCLLHNGNCTGEDCTTTMGTNRNIEFASSTTISQPSGHSNGWTDGQAGRQGDRRERYRDLQKGKERGTGRPLEEIKQSPGSCPNLKRRVVVNKPQKASSFSNV